jgi:hypothetical protein
MDRTEREKYLSQLRGLLTQLERVEKKIDRRLTSLAELEIERDNIQKQIQGVTLNED